MDIKKRVERGVNPHWILGFVDGEGSFSVSFNRRGGMKLGVEVRPSFSITQSGKRNPPKEGLEMVHRYFRCGFIRFCRLDGTFKYEVRSLDDLYNKILPFFDRFPLITPKKEDYLHFREVCTLLKGSHHLNEGGLKRIFDLSFAMNPSGRRKYRKEDLLRFMKS